MLLIAFGCVSLFRSARAAFYIELIVTRFCVFEVREHVYEFLDACMHADVQMCFVHAQACEVFTSAAPLRPDSSSLFCTVAPKESTIKCVCVLSRQAHFASLFFVSLLSHPVLSFSCVLVRLFAGAHPLARSPSQHTLSGGGEEGRHKHDAHQRDHCILLYFPTLPRYICFPSFRLFMSLRIFAYVAALSFLLSLLLALCFSALRHRFFSL